MLSVFVFLQEYSNYFIIPVKSKIKYFCYNIEVVHKINMISNNRTYFDDRHKTTDHEAVIQLKKCLLSVYATLSYAKISVQAKLFWSLQAKMYSGAITVSVSVQAKLFFNVTMSVQATFFCSVQAKLISGVITVSVFVHAKPFYVPIAVQTKLFTSVQAKLFQV